MNDAGKIGANFLGLDGKIDLATNFDGFDRSDTDQLDSGLRDWMLND